MAAASSSASPPLGLAAEHEAFLEAWRRYGRASQRARARRRCDGELSVTQAMLLGGLYEQEALTVGALAERAEIAAPTATRMIDGLERAGYVTRRHCEHDRRVVLVSLTEAGERALRERWENYRATVERASATLSAAEREQATALLLRLADLLDEL